MFSLFRTFINAVENKFTQQYSTIVFTKILVNLNIKLLYTHFVVFK